MIVVQLNGGLGNQLFQYATARRLSLSLGVRLALDTSVFRHYALRVFELNHFSVNAAVARPADIATLRWGSGILGMARRTGIVRTIAPSYIKERSYEFDPRILKLPDKSYLEGYWQSYRYFEDKTPIIRAELNLGSAPVGKNAELLEQISKADAICVHVRRGDYVSNAQTNQYHGTCSAEYYQQAVRELVVKLRRPELYIFSDDIPWVKDNLTFDLPTTYVGHNSAANAYEDIRLMTACKHFVIANSSFSWWGAWLAPYEQKEVYAPGRWFADETINTHDLTPSTWHRI